MPPQAPATGPALAMQQQPADPSSSVTPVAGKPARSKRSRRGGGGGGYAVPMPLATTTTSGSTGGSTSPSSGSGGNQGGPTKYAGTAVAGAARRNGPASSSSPSPSPSPTPPPVLSRSPGSSTSTASGSNAGPGRMSPAAGASASQSGVGRGGRGGRGSRGGVGPARRSSPLPVTTAVPASGTVGGGRIPGLAAGGGGPSPSSTASALRSMAAAPHHLRQSLTDASSARQSSSADAALASAAKNPSLPLAELELLYRRASKDHDLFDPRIAALRLKLTMAYELAILTSPTTALNRELEALWKHIVYRVIEDYRRRMRTLKAALDSGRSGESSNIAAQATTANLNSERALLESQFSGFVLQMTGLYHRLISQLARKHGLPASVVDPVGVAALGGGAPRLPKLSAPPVIGTTSGSSGDAESVPAAGVGRTEPAEAAALVTFRALIYLGDLARYRDQLLPAPVVPSTYGASDTVLQPHAVANDCYTRALRIVPDHGNPHNQRAIVATYQHRDLEAVSEYVRALLAGRPFETAKENLALAMQQGLARCSRRRSADYDRAKEAAMSVVAAAYLDTPLAADMMVAIHDGGEGDAVSEGGTTAWAAIVVDDLDAMDLVRLVVCLLGHASIGPLATSSTKAAADALPETANRPSAETHRPRELFRPLSQVPPDDPDDLATSAQRKGAVFLLSLTSRLAAKALSAYSAAHVQHQKLGRVLPALRLALLWLSTPAARSHLMASVSPSGTVGSGGPEDDMDTSSTLSSSSAAPLVIALLSGLVANLMDTLAHDPAVTSMLGAATGDAAAAVMAVLPPVTLPDDLELVVGLRPLEAHLTKVLAFLPPMDWPSTRAQSAKSAPDLKTQFGFRGIAAVTQLANARVAARSVAPEVVEVGRRVATWQAAHGAIQEWSRPMHDDHDDQAVGFVGVPIAIQQTSGGDSSVDFLDADDSRFEPLEFPSAIGTPPLVAGPPSPFHAALPEPPSVPSPGTGGGDPWTAWMSATATDRQLISPSSALEMHHLQLETGEVDYARDALYHGMQEDNELDDGLDLAADMNEVLQALAQEAAAEEEAGKRVSASASSSTAMSPLGPFMASTTTPSSPGTAALTAFSLSASGTAASSAATSPRPPGFAKRPSLLAELNAGSEVYRGSPPPPTPLGLGMGSSSTSPGSPRSPLMQQLQQHLAGLPSSMYDGLFAAVSSPPPVPVPVPVVGGGDAFGYLSSPPPPMSSSSSQPSSPSTAFMVAASLHRLADPPYLSQQQPYQQRMQHRSPPVAPAMPSSPPPPPLQMGAYSPAFPPPGLHHQQHTYQQQQSPFLQHPQQHHASPTSFGAAAAGASVGGAWAVPSPSFPVSPFVEPWGGVGGTPASQNPLSLSSLIPPTEFHLQQLQQQQQQYQWSRSPASPGGQAGGSHW
ncbi:hypothetical protein BC828DRAFT_436693 [Blastocladiella britannica]|nr:hypothetical protein BC828DRAFT_436693 [Blastocladiella britannica]